MSEHLGDFVQELKDYLKQIGKVIANETSQENPNQAWPMRDGKFSFVVNNDEWWRAFRITVEAVSIVEMYEPTGELND